MKRNERKAREVQIQLAQEETQRIVATGHCPICGAALRHNLAIIGWYQCVQFGAVGFRADASKPECNWQGFTQ